MSAVAQCLIQQAAGDSKTITSILVALNDLPRKHPISRELIQPIARLFSESDNSAKTAVGFFAATSMIQVAQSSRLLEFPLGQSRFEETVASISKFMFTCNTGFSCAAKSFIKVSRQSSSTSASTCSFPFRNFRHVRL